MDYLYKNFAVVMCNDIKQAIQKHSQVEYKKASKLEVIENMARKGTTGVLTGIRSNNLEVMDFDLKNSEDGHKFMMEFEAAVREKLGQKFIDSIVKQTTPSGGQHWMYRTKKVDGNKKISKGKNKEAIVESRGNGGYIIIAPSTGYVLMGGAERLEEIPTITPVEKDSLWLCAKMLEELDEPDPVMKAHVKKHSALTNENKGANGQPNYWENFDRDCDFLTMLEVDGWRIPARQGNQGGGKFLLVRPDKKEDAWSADLDLSGHGVPLLYVYSTSTVLESEKAYSPSSYLIYYRYNGDAVAAYDYLIDNGFAPPRKEKDIVNMDKAPETPDEAVTIFDKYHKYKITDTTKVDRPVPILTINGVGVLHTGELLTLSGEAKAGKSALLSAIISKVLNPDAQGFGIIKTEKNDLPILHFDTEQPIHRHHDNLKFHVMKRAKLDKYPEQLMSYNLRRMNVESRKLMVSELIESAKIEYGGVFMVILDGIADFIQDTNDLKQSADIVTWMLEISSDHNCGVINVIHLNPSPDGTYSKQRGHLGSTLQFKTDNLLVVKRDSTGNGEQSILTAQFLRNGGILDFGEHFMEYDRETSMHQIVQRQEFEEEPNEKYKVMARRLAGMAVNDGRRSLLDEGVVRNLNAAKKLIKDLVDFEYIIIQDGKIMSKGNLGEGKLITMKEATDEAYIGDPKNKWLADEIGQMPEMPSGKKAPF